MRMCNNRNITHALLLRKNLGLKSAQEQKEKRQFLAQLNQNGASSMSSDTNTTEGDDNSLVARTVKDITHHLTLVIGGEVSGFLTLSNRKLLDAKFK